MRQLKVILGMVLCIIGVVLTILPGSTLLVLAGLMLLSTEYTPARKLLKWVQRSMSQSAVKLDRYLLNRKMRK
ncbi:PGPGW domain-containing protein [Glaciecola sp. KUL10]|uniref:PGPGW domain-containing protein n=1 Tax=Glaciecola sp. (strain KUL10) TaxID=2161813 RepID=UPI000D7839C3|nr:PGPGW domain-containing protein [Glaciecola sp. KUL10]GBL03136.1 hypothetical protein KUL10_04170 [Glaciecola sp. KUL10]